MPTMTDTDMVVQYAFRSSARIPGEAAPAALGFRSAALPQVQEILMATEQQDWQTTNDPTVTWLGLIGTLLAFGGAIAWFVTVMPSQQCLAGQSPSPCEASVYWHGVGAGGFLVGAMMIIAAIVVGAIREH